jgi:dephospho-CoA kinase
LKPALQIGITGGIGSGKSLVCRIFSCLGIPVYDADSRAKALMTTDGILMSQIRKEFGDLSYDEEGNLNRTFLASTVFSNAEKLDRLNSLVHPRVGEDYNNWYKSVTNLAPYVLKEAALLFESGSYTQMDKIIVVFAPVELRIKRVLSRDSHRTYEQVKDIIRRQLPAEEAVKRADFIVRNDETELLVPQVISLHQNFQKELY